MKPTQHAFRFMKWIITLDCESAGRGRVVVVRDDGANAPDDTTGYEWKMVAVRIRRSNRRYDEWLRFPKRPLGWSKVVYQREISLPWFFRVLPGPRGYTVREAVERAISREPRHG